MIYVKMALALTVIEMRLMTERIIIVMISVNITVMRKIMMMIIIVIIIMIVLAMTIAMTGCGKLLREVTCDSRLSLRKLSSARKHTSTLHN